MNKIEISLIPGENGTTDLEATLEAARTDILAYMANRETEDETIKGAIDAVFDSHTEVRMNMPFVISQALQHMGIAEQPGNFKVLQRKVHDYIVANDQGKVVDKATGEVERPMSYFVKGKGKTGGLARRADLKTAEDVATVAAS